MFRIRPQTTTKSAAPYAALPWIIMWVMAPLPLYIWAAVALAI